jgi:hypothetical protein
MDKVASEIMQEPVLVEVTVSSRGEAAKMVAREGLVGSLVAGSMTGKQGQATTPGGVQGVMFLALGPTKLAFFTLKRGFFKNSAGQLIVEHPRADVTALDIEGGFPPNFSIKFADGTHYALEVGKMFLKHVKKIKEELGK